MNEDMKKRARRWGKIALEYSLIFLLGILLYVLTRLPTLMHTGGINLSILDGSQKLLPLYVDGWEKIHAPGGFAQWNWNDGLGSDTVGVAANYYFYSPYFRLSTLFNKFSILQTMTLLSALKSGVAMALFYAYSRKLRMRRWIALLGSILYIGSGPYLSGEASFYAQDALSFFPLLLLGLEYYLKDNRGLWLLLAIFLTGVLSPRYFYYITLFALLYYMLRLLWIQGWRGKETVRQFGVFVMVYLLGVMTTLFALLPALLSEQHGFTWNTGSYELLYRSVSVWFRDLIAIFCAFAYPPGYLDNNLQMLHSMGSGGSFTFSVSILFLLLLPQSYYLVPKHKRKYLLVAFCGMLLLLSSPLLLALLSGSEVVTFEWGFLLSTLMILYICYALQHRTRVEPIVMTVTCFVWMAITVLVHVFTWRELTELVLSGSDAIVAHHLAEFEAYVPLVLIPLIILAVCYTGLLMFRHNAWDLAWQSTHFSIVAILMLLLVTLEGIFGAQIYHSQLFMKDEALFAYEERLHSWMQLGDQLPPNTALHRAHVYDADYPVGLIVSEPTSRMYFQTGSSGHQGLISLLNDGIVSQNEPSVASSIPPYTYYAKLLFSSMKEARWDTPTIEWKEYPPEFPLGFPYSHFITAEEYAQLPWQDRDIALLDAFLISPEQAENMRLRGFLTFDPARPAILAPKAALPIGAQAQIQEDGELYIPTGANLGRDNIRLIHNGTDVLKQKRSAHDAAYQSVPVLQGDFVELVDDDRILTQLECYFQPAAGRTSKEDLLQSRGVYENVEVIADTIRFDYNNAASAVMLYLSVPYRAGWSAKINGTPVPIDRIQGDMMGVQAVEGANAVVLTYENPYVMPGQYLSLGALPLVALYVLRSRKEKGEQDSLGDTMEIWYL